jgi:hypothetical protein
MATKKQKAHKKLQANSQQNYNNRGRGDALGAKLGGGYHFADTKRDVWTVAGYPDKVLFSNLWNMQARFGIAKAGIHRIVDKCWQSPPKITDGPNDGKRALTAFEKDLDVLINKHALFARLKGADWRNRIGRYSGIMPIVTEIDTSTRPESPASKSRGIESLFKLVPLLESQLDVTDVNSNSNINSPDYGMPEYYNLRQDVEGDRNPVVNVEIQLDPSRVFIFAEGADDGSIFGIPANEAGYNSLLDLEKICVAGSEGHYKNAKQRTVVNVSDNQVANVLSTNKEKKAVWEQAAADFASGFDTMLTTYGMEVHQLQSTLSDPTHPFTNSLNVYAASISIPATILIGQQTGRLASDEDQSDWAKTAESRRQNTLTPSIIAFLEYLVGRGIMNKPSDKIMVEWDGLSEPSSSERLTNGKSMAEMNKLAFETGRAEPYFSDQEVRKESGYEEMADEDLEGFGEDDDLDP